MDNNKRNQILDSAIADIRSQQEQDLVIDFDRAVEARRKEAIVIKYKGKEYKIPPETPQWYMNIVNRKIHELKSLNLEDMSEEEIMEKAEIDDKHNEQIFRRLFGDEFVDEYLNDNFVSMSVLNKELLNPILVKWGWKPAEDTTKKKKMKGS